MDAAWHEVVSRTLRGRFGENRRLDLEEAARAEKATRLLHQPMPKNQVLLQLGAAQVEVAVTETQLFCRQLLSLSARDGDRRRGGRPNDFDARRTHFDFTGCKLGVSHLRRTRDDLALDQNH